MALLHRFIPISLFCLLCACASKKAPPPSGTPENLQFGAFRLTAEPEVTCVRADKLDVNRGHSPENFVKDFYCQLTGNPAPAALVSQWSDALRNDSYVRRIDVARELCIAANRQCSFTYSDPWTNQPDLIGAPTLAGTRQIGAVCMFFFSCPGSTNCEMDAANTHAPGMDAAVPSLGFNGNPAAGIYAPNNPGFWRRELLDAQYAGLSFLLPNAYGPDITNGQLFALEEVLESLSNPIGIGLFDDTSAWGQSYSPTPYNQAPDMSDTDTAAQTLYQNKWKPFFSQINPKYWFRFAGRPFIYFYNAGRLQPLTDAAPVIAEMKQLFFADFGEEPFVSVDSAYFADPRMSTVADSEFVWDGFSVSGNRYRSTLNGHTIDHAMVRWDSLDRDQPGAIATAKTRLAKDATLLNQVLAGSHDADLLVIATWNDLLEGTGINRNYDYYLDGDWVAPDYFIEIVRQAQSTP